LADGGLLVGGALGAVFVGVELEAGAGIVVGFDVVAGQAGERNAATGRTAGIAFTGVVGLLADIG
jgi:hypothetical protein